MKKKQQKKMRVIQKFFPLFFGMLKKKIENTKENVYFTFIGLTVACFFLLLCFACISRSSFRALLVSCSVGGWPGRGGGGEEPEKTSLK